MNTTKQLVCFCLYLCLVVISAKPLRYELENTHIIGGAKLGETITKGLTIKNH